MCNICVTFTVMITMAIICKTEQLVTGRCEDICIINERSLQERIQCIEDNCYGVSARLFGPLLHRTASQRKRDESDGYAKRSDEALALQGGMLSGGYLAQKAAICDSVCADKNRSLRRALICSRIGCGGD